ncbi:hypothetical protein J2Y55_001129 [Bosea sp. BE125]|nr:hypothetical protein [Bosea sp. BE125]
MIGATWERGEGHQIAVLGATLKPAPDSLAAWILAHGAAIRRECGDQMYRNVPPGRSRRF